MSAHRHVTDTPLTRSFELVESGRLHGAGDCIGVACQGGGDSLVFGGSSEVYLSIDASLDDGASTPVTGGSPHTGFRLSYTSVPQCRPVGANDCTGRGQCQPATGLCVCEPLFHGQGCEFRQSAGRLDLAAPPVAVGGGGGEVVGGATTAAALVTHSAGVATGAWNFYRVSLGDWTVGHNARITLKVRSATSLTHVPDPRH